jgi:hypothetical protein
LKDSKCKKGQLSSQLPILYIPPMDLITTKEELQSLKIKLPEVFVFNMSIYTLGNTKEYLAHIVAVLRIIKQKGMDIQCRMLGKAVVKLTGTFKDLLRASGSKDTVLLDDDVEVNKLEIKETQKMLQEEQHDKAITKTYKLLRNLLSSDLQSQWDCISRKMHKCDSWAGVNGQGGVGRFPCMWAAFQGCLELYKLTVFTADTAKRQQLYIQQAVHKPQRATVQQHILQMGVLNDYVRHLPKLKDSPKAVSTMKKGNAPLGKADLAAIMLSSVPTAWQNQYNLNHTTVLESTRMLLPNLEAIKQVMVEKHQEKLKAKGKAATARPEAKGNPKCKASRSPTGQVPKTGHSEKFCQCCVPTRPTTPWTAVVMTAMISPSRHQQVSPLSPRSPTRSLGAIRAWPFMQHMFEAYAKASKKVGKSKKQKKQ